jgi:hypothetical protein
MKCDLKSREKQIEAFLTHTLSPEEAEAFSDHFFNCDVCYEELRLREEMQDLIRAEGNVLFAGALATPPKRRRRFALLPLKWKWALAPAAAAAVMLVAFFIIAQNKEAGKRFSGPSFDESANLEDFIRHPAYRSSQRIRITSSANGAIVSRQARFRWQTDYDGPIYWKLLNNKEEVVTSATTGNNEYVLEKITLPPGLYYWKLESDKDLLHVGKFFVNKQE